MEIKKPEPYLKLLFELVMYGVIGWVIGIIITYTIIITMILVLVIFYPLC
jgi:hypothetical protein